MLAGVLTWGGVPLVQSLTSDAARVRDARRVALERAPLAATPRTAVSQRLDGRRPVVPRRLSAIPDVGEWADRVGVPVSAATPPAPVSSPFGLREHPVSGGLRAHTGVDFASPRGTPVSATASGVVVAAGRLGGYGIRVEVRHPHSGLTTRYAHLGRIGPGIRVGHAVRRGALVGFVGSTGVVTGPHLHYEVRDPSGVPLDPAVLARRYQADWARAFRTHGRRGHDPRQVGSARVPAMRLPRG